MDPHDEPNRDSSLQTELRNGEGPNRSGDRRRPVGISGKESAKFWRRNGLVRQLSFFQSNPSHLLSLTENHAHKIKMKPLTISSLRTAVRLRHTDELLESVGGPSPSYGSQMSDSATLDFLSLVEQFRALWDPSRDEYANSILQSTLWQ